jgi:hypothetical protein
MKKHLVVLSAIFMSPLLLRAEVSPVRMSVEQSTVKSIEDPSDKTHHTRTQTRALRIQLDNNSSDSFDGLVVKYWFFGRTPNDSQVKVLSIGERKSSLAPRGRDVVESETISKRSVDEHMEPPKGGKTGKPTKVPASGEKIIGYAVRLMKGDKVLSEAYSEPSFKAVVDSGATPPAPTAAKGAPAKGAPAKPAVKK